MEITTVTLNPALDEAISIDRVALGSVNRCDLDALDPGGKGLNASRVVARLGRRTLALGFLAGVTGALIRTRLDAEGVPHAFDDLPGMTRINVMLYERSGERRTRLYLPGPPATARDLASVSARLDQVPEGGVVVIAGSLPPGLGPETYRDLVARLRARGVRTVVEASGEALELVLAAGPDLVKPNLEEAGVLLGRTVADDDDAVRAAWDIVARGARSVVVSQGAEGAIGVAGDRAWKVVPPSVAVRSTVGSGDSMVAGLAIAIAEGSGLAEGMRLGSAAGTATAAVPGTQLCAASEVERLLPRVEVRAIAV